MGNKGLTRVTVGEETKNLKFDGKGRVYWNTNDTWLRIEDWKAYRSYCRPYLRSMFTEEPETKEECLKQIKIAERLERGLDISSWSKDRYSNSYAKAVIRLTNLLPLFDLDASWEHYSPGFVRFLNGRFGRPLIYATSSRKWRVEGRTPFKWYHSGDHKKFVENHLNEQ